MVCAEEGSSSAASSAAPPLVRFFLPGRCFTTASLAAAGGRRCIWSTLCRWPRVGGVRINAPFVRGHAPPLSALSVSVGGGTEEPGCVSVAYMNEGSAGAIQ